MNYTEFLDTVKVLKMLYGRDIAEKFFTKNKEQFKILDSVSVSKLQKKG